eukprot:1138624-Prymnesium_polylepis.1
MRLVQSWVRFWGWRTATGAAESMTPVASLLEMCKGTGRSRGWTRPAACAARQPRRTPRPYSPALAG